jgi:hypothetical protein
MIERMVSEKIEQALANLPVTQQVSQISQSEAILAGSNVRSISGVGGRVGWMLGMPAEPR